MTATLKDYALTTPSRFAAFAGISLNSTQTDVVTHMINALTEFIEKYIGQRIQLTTYTQEEYDSEHGDSLVLKRRPIGTFTSLERRNSALNEDDWETIDAQYYHVDTDAGIIYGAAGWKFGRCRRGYRVTYTAGYDFDNSTTFLSDTEGAELELVAWQLLKTVWDRRKGGVGVSSESIGDYKVVYSGAMLENEDVKAILDKFADIATGGVLTPFHY